MCTGLHSKTRRVLVLTVFAAWTAAAAAEWPEDLNPVKLRAAPAHAPVVLVEKGQPKASICVMTESSGAPATSVPRPTRMPRSR